jgi:site-specific DNA recombinase
VIDTVIQKHYIRNVKRAARVVETTKRAVLYCRVSLTKQAEEGVSLDAQQARARAWAAANGYTVADADVHVDAGLSGGRADNRPALQAALANVRMDGAALVVYSLSRLSRSVKDVLTIAEALDGAGANLVSLSESIDTTSAMGRFTFKLLACLGELERELVAERTSASMQHLRSLGQFTGGDAPFGHRVREDGSLEAIPQEQAVIGLARSLRAEGLGFRAIARRLAAEGHRSRTGRAFHHEQVSRMVAQ